MILHLLLVRYSLFIIFDWVCFNKQKNKLKAKIFAYKFVFFDFKDKDLKTYFFLCLFFLSLFLRLCVDILCLFLFLPLGILICLFYEKFILLRSRKFLLV